MTAMNLIVQPRAGAAWLLTDTAAYQRGRVSEFTRKVIELRVGGRNAVAVAASGLIHPMHFEPYAEELNAPGLPKLLSIFPEVFREIERHCIENGKVERCGHRRMAAVIAAYDHEARRPVGFGITNTPNFFPPTHPLYKLQPIKWHLTEFAGEPFEPGTDLADPRQWKPETDAEALIEAQRADPFGEPDRPYYAVGGEAILTRVNAEGIHHRIVKTWPDRIGRRIDPNRKAGWRERLTPPWLRPSFQSEKADAQNSRS